MGNSPKGYTATRTLFIGAHVSIAGGVHNAPQNAIDIGARAFGLFLKSPRQWKTTPLRAQDAEDFRTLCKRYKYDTNYHVVPHGSYLVNLAHVDPDRTKQAYNAFLSDLQRCEALGLKLYNFHPGVANSTKGDRGKAIAHLARCINQAHRETTFVVILLENMAAGGNVLGSTFEDLHDIIALINEKHRVGVCVDTCHAFASGYDLRTPESFSATIEDFDRIVGLQYLRAIHLNDSKTPLASKRDLHANIGTGFIGLRAFHNIINDRRFSDIPLILETPMDMTDEEEINLLASLVDMDIESEAYTVLEKGLAKRGEADRQKMSQQIAVKEQKTRSKTERATERRRKRKRSD